MIRRPRRYTRTDTHVPTTKLFRSGRVADHVAPAREQRRAIDADAGERQARLALRDDPAAGVEHEVAARVMRRVVDQHQVRIARRFGRQAAEVVVDRKSGVWGKGGSVRVDPGGRGIIKKKNKNTTRV